MTGLANADGARVRRGGARTTRGRAYDEGARERRGGVEKILPLSKSKKKKHWLELSEKKLDEIKDFPLFFL